MLRRLLFVGALVATALGANAFRSESADEAAIRAAIEHYFQGHATGDGNHFRVVFHPEAKLFAIRDGKFWQLSSADYAARANGTPPADEASRKRWIEEIDVTGDAAMVKLILDYPGVKLTDYMSMLRVDGKWMIVNKIFQGVPK
ncbi:MAG: nuclear transport factor 2 family protein [Gemmatimonadales bacterium]